MSIILDSKADPFLRIIMKFKMCFWLFGGLLLVFAIGVLLGAGPTGEVAASERMVAVNDITPAVEISDDQLKVIETSLNNHNFAEFESRTISALPAGCPSIYSSWHCERLAESKS